MTTNEAGAHTRHRSDPWSAPGCSVNNKASITESSGNVCIRSSRAKQHHHPKQPHPFERLRGKTKAGQRIKCNELYMRRHHHSSRAICVSKSERWYQSSQGIADVSHAVSSHSARSIKVTQSRCANNRRHNSRGIVTMSQSQEQVRLLVARHRFVAVVVGTSGTDTKERRSSGIRHTGHMGQLRLRIRMKLGVG